MGATTCSPSRSGPVLGPGPASTQLITATCCPLACSRAAWHEVFVHMPCCSSCSSCRNNPACELAASQLSGLTATASDICLRASHAGTCRCAWTVLQRSSSSCRDRSQLSSRRSSTAWESRPGEARSSARRGHEWYRASHVDRAGRAA